MGLLKGMSIIAMALKGPAIPYIFVMKPFSFNGAYRTSFRSKNTVRNKRQSGANAMLGSSIGKYILGIEFRHISIEHAFHILQTTAFCRHINLHFQTKEYETQS